MSPRACVSRFVLSLLLIAVVGCSSVKIETGQTEREAKLEVNQQASQVRGEWAAKIKPLNSQQTAVELTSYLNGVCTRYLAFGDDVASRWHEASAGRGEEVDAKEMLNYVETWTNKQKPLLVAYTDNIEFAASKIKAAGELAPDDIERINELVGVYYRVYNAVFYPSKNVDLYEQELARSHQSLTRLTDNLQRHFGGS